MPGKPALQAFLEKEFGGSFVANAKSLTVGTTEKVVIPNNFERLGLAIVSLSSNNLFLSPVEGVSATNGIELSGSGASLTLTARDDLVLVGNSWYGIADSGASNTLYYVEVVRYAGMSANANP